MVTGGEFVPFFALLLAIAHEEWPDKGLVMKRLKPQIAGFECCQREVVLMSRK